MIAGPYQGKGYGRRALQMVIDDLKAQGAKELSTSCGEGEASPEGFYRSLGFERDGNMYGDDVGLRMSFID
jgi:diamine N-acetyltransferase